MRIWTAFDNALNFDQPMIPVDEARPILEVSTSPLGHSLRRYMGRVEDDSSRVFSRRRALALTALLCVISVCGMAWGYLVWGGGRRAA